MNQPILYINKRGKAASAFMLIIALLAWFGLIAQLSITLSNHQPGRTLPGVLIQFISYFTVICNALVSISLTAILLNPASGTGHFFSRNTILTAITLYIMVVGIVFNTVLRNLLDLTGLAWWVNEIMHVFIPVLFTAFWLAVVPKGGLSYKNTLPWLWVPFIYLVYTLIRGALCGLYPYPFMDAGKLGYPQVAINSLAVLMVILISGSLLIFVARLLRSK
ncbi:MAG: Pr6Pr family membrane protein [Bacteroidota bacterium]